MPLPDNFSPWEHLQDTLRWVQNRRVYEEFRDVGADDWPPDITTPRASLRVACTLRDDDTADMTMLRLWLFYGMLGNLPIDLSNFYSIPVEEYQAMTRFQPQITLLFYEDLGDVEDGYQPVHARISFRLPGETEETMTKAKATLLATQIKNEFALANGYKWWKGRTKLSYRKPQQGYKFSLFAKTETEGKEVIQKVLSLQNNTLDLDCLTISELADPPPIIPPMKMIYGEMRREARVRPVAHVRFRKADMHLWGVQRSITLINMVMPKKGLVQP